jgi:membrane dipeptidase
MTSLQAALELHRSTPVVDLHADTFELVQTIGYDLAREHRSMAMAGQLLGHVDLPRLRRGGVSAMVFGLVMPPWTSRRGAERRIAGRAELMARTCRRLEADLVRACTAEDVVAAHRDGKVAAFLGVEGSFGIAGNAAALDLLVEHRVRYLSPAHLFGTEAGPSNWGRAPAAAADAALELVDELWRRDLLVDLAHMARGPFLEICRRATRPVIVSHTGLAALCPMWRNIDDEQIRAVARTGGVVGVIMTPRFLGGPGAAAVAAHLAHLIDAGGEDVAALGSDFDGLVRPPHDLVDAAGLPRVTAELLDRGTPEPVVRKVLGQNALRVFAEATAS